MFSTMIWLAAILAGFVAAQFTSSNLTIPSFVDLDRKVQWCLAEINTCPDLCGGASFNRENRCIGSELPKFDCICSNGTAPADIEDYVGSVPNSVCLATFEQCRQENPGSDDCPVCGTLKASDVPKGVVSSTISTTATATSTVAADSASAAAASTTPTGTSGAVATAPLAGGISGGLAMAMMAALGGLFC